MRRSAAPVSHSSSLEDYMSTSVSPAVGTRDGRSTDHRNTTERRTTETKASFKTSEFMAYAAVLVGILIAGLVVDNGSNSGFGAQEVWLYSTILTVGYMISRGLAKAGSRDPYTHDRSDG
jgi:hypothetical protein